MHLPNVLSIEIVDYSVDEIVSHDYGTDRFPIAGVFSEQQTNRLQSQFYDSWWIRHGTDLHQLLLFDRLYGCATTKKTKKISKIKRKYSAAVQLILSVFRVPVVNNV